MTPNPFTQEHKRARRRFAIAMGLYVVIIAGGSYALVHMKSRPGWLAPVVGVAAAVPALYGLLVGQATTRRYEGIERDIMYRSTSIAFFTTMAFSLATALYATFMRTTGPHPWWFYTVGMLTWLVTTLVMRRRLG
jgi:cation transport ATPase